MFPKITVLKTDRYILWYTVIIVVMHNFPWIDCLLVV